MVETVRAKKKKIGILNLDVFRKMGCFYKVFYFVGKSFLYRAR